MGFNFTAKKYISLLLFLGAGLYSFAGVPTVTVTAPAGPTNNATLAFTVTFSEDVTGFDDAVADLNIVSATGGSVVGVIVPLDAANYTVNLSGMTAPSGSVSLEIPASAALSVSTGDPNTISNTDAVVWDGVAPAVTVEKKAGQADPTNVSPVLFTVTFDSPINGASFVAGDINLTASTLGGAAVLTPSLTEVAPMDQTTYQVSVAITGSPVSGNVIASLNASAVFDLAGNGNTASSSSDNIVAYDLTGPTVTINKKIGQADPTNVSPVLFTVTFNEAINVGSFLPADINLSASTLGGAATLTPSITVVTPNTVFEVSVAITGTPVSGDVIASIDAAVLTDVLGNNNTASSSSDNIVAYTLAPPTVTTPTVAVISDVGATLGGNITFNGGSAITERGTVWKTSSPVTIADNKVAEGGTSTGVFSHARAGMPSATQIFFAAYGTNAIGSALSPESSFYTFALNPTAHPGALSATAVSSSQINLTFTDPATIGAGSVKGYIILRNSAMNPTVGHINAPNDGLAPGALTFNNGTVLAGTVISGTTFNNTGLTGGTNYRYLIIPFNVDNAGAPNSLTYNYKTDGSPVAPTNAVTFSAISNIEYLGNSTGSIDYKSFQSASGLTGGGSPNSVYMAEFEVRDGGSAGSDGDGQSTTLTSLTITLGNYQNVRTVALFDGSTNLSEQAVAGANVTFPGLSLVATDDNDKAFRIRATFMDVVDDNEFISVTIFAATAASSGSNFAAANAGAATTGGATNQIEVTASKLIFLSAPSALVNAAFSITVNAVDDPLENLDLDETGQVNPLGISPNPNGAVLSTTAEALNPSLVAGVFTWTQLHINLSGVHNLRATHPLIDAQGPVTITSNGVTITPGTVPLSPVCYSGAFQTLSNVVITEGDPSDFAMGNNQVFSMVLPGGFIFDTSVTPAPLLSGTGMSNAVAASYVGNSIVRVGYDITGVANINSLTITGLKVKYTGNTPTSGNILRYGGSAVIAGNMDADAKNHGTLTAAPSATVVDFTVDELPGQPVVDPAETRFSINTATVKLIGSPPGGVFTGNGVILSPSNGYTFNPTSVGVGSNYPVVYTFTEAGGQQCQVTHTKTFEVYASIITNLNLAYCTNGAQSLNMSVTQGQIDALYGGSGTYVFHDFVYYNPCCGYIPIADPSNDIFKPSSPDYVTTTQIYGGVYIYYRVHHFLTPLSPQFAQYQFVTMNVAPNVTFTTATLQTSFCQDEPPVQLIGNPANSNTTANDFFSAAGAGAASVGSGGSPVVWTFTPSAVTGVSPGVSVSFNMTYTYKDLYSQCSNTSAPISITVHPRPGPVLAGEVTSGISLHTCVNSGSVTFTTSAPPTTTYKWYSNNSLNQAAFLVNGSAFSPSVTTPMQLDVSTPGTTNFYVTQTINGCESLTSPTLSAIVDAPAVANAGGDATICQGSPVVFSTLLPIPSMGGSATPGAPASQWSALGTSPGSFSPSAGFTSATQYIPSANDIASGSAVLRLTTDDPTGPCPAVFDDVFITINKVAVVNAGGDATVCSGQNISLNGNISGGVTSGTWTRNGQGGFDLGNTVTTTNTLTFYNPSASELTTGATITFTLTSDDPDGPGPCPTINDAVDVTINQRSLISAGTDLVKCSYDLLQLNGTIPPNSSATSFTWTGGAGSFSPDPNTGNATYIATASELTGTTLVLSITSDDSDGPGGPCSAETDDVLLTVNPRPSNPTVSQPSDYCVGDAIANLLGSGTNMKWYDDVGLTNQVGVGTSFASGVSNTAEIVVPFYATQTLLSCESFGATVTITVNPLPVPDFSAVNYCFGDFMTFTDASTISTGSIAAWSWRFDDGLDLAPGTGAIPAGTHGGQTIGTYDDPQHKYGGLGVYNVRLTAVSDKGCFQFVQKPFSVGPTPKADFTIQDVCDQDNTQFTYTGTVPGQITTWAWDFGDATSGSNNIASIQNPAHTFTGVNTYPVTLTVTTNLGCQDMLTKNAFILPYVKSFPYQESFETTNHGWVTEGLNAFPFNTTSWTVGPPSGSVINAAANGTRAWMTRDNTLGTYNNSERSVLYGPCFDMTQLPRPVLSMQYWNETDPGNDGAYFEFSLNNGVSWQRLGILSEGLEWYNRAAILGLSQIVGIGQAIAQIGWSGSTGGWKGGKHNMDNFSTVTKLRLRLVFGSNPDNPSLLDGFAMDNFVMETRNRVILSENFTSTMAANAATNNQNFISFKQTNPNELVKLQYHIDLPAADDINRQNPADPNARAAFYGLTNSSAIVPQVFLDGAGYKDATPNDPGNFTKGTGWADVVYNSRSLVTAPLSINLTTLPTDNNKIALSATITAQNAITSGKLAIIFAVVEKVVGSDQFIVRKLLPSPTGALLTLPLAINQSVTFTPEPWEVKNINSISQLSVLAFVQDLDTHDILQSAYVSNPGNLPTVITGVEGITAENLIVFPNPSDKELTIQLPSAARQKVGLKMVDQVGKVVHDSFIKAGDKGKTIGTQDLSAGIYILQVESGQGEIARKKVLIVHDK